jgi:hypothetical protein
LKDTDIIPLNKLLGASTSGYSSRNLTRRRMIMNQKHTDLEKLYFSIPRLWEKDWNQTINNASGVQKNILIVQKRAADLLSQISDTRVTFARLAWFNIWTRVFSILEGIFCALPKNSLYVLHLLGRTSFEMTLQAQSIMEPVLRIHQGIEKENKTTNASNPLKNGKEESIKRLEAYAAYCIWNDSLYYDQIVKPENLNTVWDAKPAEQIYEDLNRLAAYEAIYGKLKVETDEQELKKGRLRQQDEGQHRLHRLRTWLDHPDLIHWHNRLKKCGYMTFFTLISEAKTSVKNSLDGFDLSFGYSIYSEGSMVIHGSTIDQFIHFGDKSVTPLFLAAEDQITEKSEEIGNNCNQVILLLYFLLKIIWPQQSSSNP